MFLFVELNYFSLRWFMKSFIYEWFHKMPSCLLSTSPKKCSIFLRKKLCIPVYPYTMRCGLGSLKICEKATEKLAYICLQAQKSVPFFWGKSSVYRYTRIPWDMVWAVWKSVRELQRNQLIPVYCLPAKKSVPFFWEKSSVYPYTHIPSECL